MIAQLKQKKRWLLCALPDKAPRIERNGELIHASIKNTDAFMTYEDAVDAKERYGCGIGYVLCDGDGLACVDIDLKKASDKEKKAAVQVAKSLDTFTELSQSGLGLHAWVTVPQSFKGMRKGFYEVYSRDRFIVCTGNTFIEKPIAPANEAFYEFISTLKSDKTQALLPTSDEEIIATIHQKGGKYDELFTHGGWEKHGYTSHSEGDLALQRYISTFTKDPEQIIRIFRASALADRPKAHRDDYMAFNLNALAVEREKQAQNDAASREFARSIAEDVVDPKAYELNENDIPPGPLGALTNYCLNVQHHPNIAIAITAAISFAAGVCGRAYTVSNTGLNMYMLFVGKTGIGKGGIETALNNLAMNVAFANEFIVQDFIVSAPALHKMIAKKKAVIHCFGEISQKLQSRKDSDLHLQYMRELLMLYDKSGPNKTLGGLRYSDSEKDVDGDTNVAYSLVGEGTPTGLYGAMDNAMKSDGTLSRFIVVKTDADQPVRNKKASEAQLDEGLRNLLGTIAHRARQQIQYDNDPIACVFDDDAKSLINAFEEECRKKINACDDDDDFTRSVWNRANLKVLRLAALCAAFKDYNITTVTIDAECVVWARDFVKKTMLSLIAEDKKGNIGDGDTEQEKAIINAVQKFYKDKHLVKDNDPRTRYYLVLREHGYVPLRYIFEQTKKKKCFNGRYKTASQSINEQLKAMCDRGSCAEVQSLNIGELCLKGKYYQFFND